MDKKYPIVEIFHSVQGEGFHTGVPHVFVRFGNCNLRCEWCDTDFLTYDEMSLTHIIEQILSFDCKRVIFTGGEPAMQDLSTIGSILKENDFLVILDVGAYGMSLASNYCFRPKPAEILIKGSKINIIKKRQKLTDLI